MANTNQNSMLDIAYEYMLDQKGAVNFYDLYALVCEKKGYTEEEIEAKRSQFYTNISIDGRFLTVGENNWDLRDRHKFEDIHIDMNDVYAEEEDEDAEFGESLEDDDDGDSEEDSFDDIDN